jgi:hypothetical protein
MLADDIQAGFPDASSSRATCVGCANSLTRTTARSADASSFDTDGSSAWFGDDEEAASKFAVFGCGPDGSLYALWLHAGNDSARAPVVLLDSECAANKVVAADCREFLRLLAIGYEEPGRHPTLEPEDPDSAEGLRDWLSKEFGLSAPATAAELVTSAQSKHPDLAEWVWAWQKRRKGA